MTAGDGGTESDSSYRREEVRRALARVAELFVNDVEISVEQLRAVPGYQLIPAAVQDALEQMTPDERQAVSRLFRSLADNHFYFEEGVGGFLFY